MHTTALTPTPLMDSDHPAVVAFSERHARGSDDVARAVALYYAVRDGFRYDPYRIDLSPAGMKASTVLANGYGWCVPKATLLAAACRAVGIAARVGFADVRNHLSTERMRQVMQTDVFYWHGYAEKGAKYEQDWWLPRSLASFFWDSRHRIRPGVKGVGAQVFFNPMQSPCPFRTFLWRTFKERQSRFRPLKER